jgi:hypothetical protein
MRQTSKTIPALIAAALQKLTSLRLTIQFDEELFFASELWKLRYAQRWAKKSKSLFRNP